MENPLISVIVPVYNVEQYLQRCVESILKQNYKNIEIILIDDGSTDGSGALCDRYAQTDVRVKVIHKGNGGQSDARNIGMRKAQGTFVTFVDSDDYIAVDYIFYLYNILERNNTQISMCDCLHFCNETIEESVIQKDITDVFDAQEGIFRLLYQKGIVTSIWGKLFCYTLFNEIQFPVGKIHEDVAVLYRLFDKASKIAYGNEKKYFYYHRMGSTMNSVFTLQRMDYIFFTKQCIEYMEKEHPSLWKAAVSRHFSACFELLVCIGNSRKLYSDTFEHLAGEIKKYRKIVLFDTNARKKNRLAAAGTYLSLQAVLYAVQFLERRKF